ncbi:MAG: TerC family protein [Kiloniellales bacterium]
MLSFLLDLDLWSALLTLTALEIVLGIDNVIFISVIAARLPPEKQAFVRRLGLALALFGRLALLASLAWIVGLTAPLFSLGEFVVSWRDIILFAGGLFLLAKGTMEIHDTVEGTDHPEGGPRRATMSGAIGQILVLDLVFSLDSIITAVGMTDRLGVMSAAVVIAVLVMLLASGPVSAFIQRYPTSKMLALSFLLLVGMALVADGLGVHVPRGYLYFAIAFSAGVEALNILAMNRRRKNRTET